jgi:signal transduction histidine kinase
VARLPESGHHFAASLARLRLGQMSRVFHIARRSRIVVVVVVALSTLRIFDYDSDYDNDNDNDNERTSGSLDFGSDGLVRAYPRALRGAVRG